MLWRKVEYYRVPTTITCWKLTPTTTGTYASVKHDVIIASDSYIWLFHRYLYVLQGCVVYVEWCWLRVSALNDKPHRTAPHRVASHPSHREEYEGSSSASKDG